MSKKNQSLEECPAAHPQLRAHMLALLGIAESDIDLADEAEERTIAGRGGRARPG